MALLITHILRDQDIRPSSPFSIELDKPRTSHRGGYLRVTNLSFDLRRLRECVRQAMKDPVLHATNAGRMSIDAQPTRDGRNNGVVGIDGIDMSLSTAQDTVANGALVVPDHDEAECEFMHFIRAPADPEGEDFGSTRFWNNEILQARTRSHALYTPHPK